MTDYKKSADELHRVQTALQTLSPPNEAYNEEQWPKTRHIAELCKLNIYISRYYLIKLVKDKKAYVSSRPINNSLRWYIAEPAAYPDIPFQEKLTSSTSGEQMSSDAKEKHAIRKIS